jgi:PAS domain S-box-containing protein
LIDVQVYQSLIDTLDFQVFSVDCNFQYTGFNRSHADVMKALFNADIKIGKSILDCLTVTLDREIAIKNIKKALQGESVVASDCIGEGLSRRWFEVMYNPIYAGSGEIIGVGVYARDVTRLRESEEARRLSEQSWSESEKRYRTLLEGTADFYFETDLAGNFTFTNNSMCSTLGYSMDEIIGMNYRSVTMESDVGRVYETFNEQYRQNKLLVLSSFLTIHKNGETGHVEVLTALLRDKQGQIVGFRCIGRDIGKRLQMEAEILHLASLLKNNINPVNEISTHS